MPKHATPIHPVLYSNLVQQFLSNLNPANFFRGDVQSTWQMVLQYSDNMKQLQAQHRQAAEKLAQVETAMHRVSGPSQIGSRINRLR